MILLVPPCPADTYPRQPGVDVIHYAFRLTLRDETDEIEGAATVDVKFLKDGLTELRLDLASPASGKGMTVSSVTCRGAAAKFEHKDDRLRITLDPPPKAGERRSFTVTYRGVPSAGLRIGKNRHGERTFFSENWPDHGPRVAADDRPPERQGHQRVLVTAPARYQVVSNGLLQEETDLGDGRRLTHWKQSVPIAPWLNALASPSSRRTMPALVRGIPLESWVFPQDREAVVPALEGPGASGAGILLRAHRPVPLREARGGTGGGAQRRDGAGQRDLLRRAERLGPRRRPASSPMRSRTSGSATRSPSATGTTSG